MYSGTRAGIFYYGGGANPSNPLFCDKYQKIMGKNRDISVGEGWARGPISDFQYVLTFFSSRYSTDLLK